MTILICPLCGKRENEDNDSFFIGKLGGICSTCARQIAVLTSRDDISRKRSSNKQSRKSIVWKDSRPTLIKAYLDDFVVGQEQAKKVLSVAVYNHYKRLNRTVQKEEETPLEKANILVLGETGVGKTYLLKTIARKLQVPFYIADATALTQAGYVGEDVENILTGLLRAADYSTKAAEQGIVYIDEFDKLASKGDNASITRDVSGEGVQQGLLKMIEGSQVNVSPEGGRKHPNQRLVTIDTHNILFICGGAFDGIEAIIKNRLQAAAIGFQIIKGGSGRVPKQKLLQYIESQDIRKYGIIPELVGRLPVIVHLDPLTRNMLKRILIHSKHAVLKQYQKLFEMEGITLSFTENAIDYIVDKVFEKKLGARSLRGMLEKILTDAMFALSGQQKTTALKVDKKYVMSKLIPPDIGAIKPTMDQAA